MILIWVMHVDTHNFELWWHFLQVLEVRGRFKKNGGLSDDVAFIIFSSIHNLFEYDSSRSIFFFIQTFLINHFNLVNIW